MNTYANHGMNQSINPQSKPTQQGINKTINGFFNLCWDGSASKPYVYV